MAPPTGSKSQEKDVLRKTARIRAAAMALRMPAMAIGCQWIHLMRVPPRLQKSAARRSRVRARGRSRFDRSFRRDEHEFMGHAITKGDSCFLALFLYFLLVFLYPAIIFFVRQKKKRRTS